MNKKVLVSLIILFALGFGICIYSQCEWAFQMFIAGVVMVIIIVIKSRDGYDNSVQTNLAELATIFGITLSPGIMDGFLPYLSDFRTWVNTYVMLDWLGLNVYKNLLYIIAIAIMYMLAHLANKLFQDKTIMKKHHGKLLPPFDNGDFKRRRNNFCSMLKSDIIKIDIDTQWNDYYFTPLEAEVIVEEYNKTKKKINDLMKALKGKSHENAFLILGDPGSGKSTVLRKLANDLLKEVDKTNKIPLYINLKEWDIHEAFSETSPPQLHHLLDFIKQNLEERLGDIFVPDFLNDYFNELYQQGYFYFIFDSFDEIPMLLDEPETSWLVDRVSSLLYSVCAHNKNTKVILSSRFFRQPSAQFHAQIKMHIKPFSEANMQICFKNITNSNQLAIKLFSEHKELINIAKNPFYASLVSLYYKNSQQLPTKEVDLYDKFIHSRLEQCERVFGNLAKNNITIPEVIAYAQKLAITIFNDSNYGIEIPFQVLLNIGIPEYVIDILYKSKLIRIGGGFKKAISFSHRRFNEYFVACSLMNREINIYIESIPVDSKWRDTLVLYAQICSDDKAKELIKFCCSFFDKVNLDNEYQKENKKNKKSSKWIIEFRKFLDKLIPIEDKNENEEKPFYYQKKIIINDNFRKALHSLRFLVAAFSSQPSFLISFQKEIFKMASLLLNENNILYHKIAMQTVPILSQENIEIILDKVLSKNIPWINDEAIQNCSYLNNINSKIFLRIVRYFTFMNASKLIKGIGQHLFYLSLSRNFKTIRKFCIFRFASYIIAIILIPIFMFAFTSYDAFIIIICLIFCQIAFPWLFKSFLPYRLEHSNEIINIYTNPVFLFSICIFCLIKRQYDSALILMLFPTNVNIYFYILWSKYNYKDFIKKIKSQYKLILLLLIVCALFSGGFLLLISILEPSKLVVLSIWMILFLAYVVKYLYSFYNDIHRFRKIEFFKTIDRDSISEMLFELKTAYYQKKFLTCLKVNNVQAVGEWKDSEFPKLRKYDLIIMLAQMEEKWSGL